MKQQKIIHMDNEYQHKPKNTTLDVIELSTHDQ